MTICNMFVCLQAWFITVTCSHQRNEQQEYVKIEMKFLRFVSFAWYFPVVEQSRERNRFLTFSFAHLFYCDRLQMHNAQCIADCTLCDVNVHINTTNVHFYGFGRLIFHFGITEEKKNGVKLNFRNHEIRYSR